jgi:acyl-CoA reductase-like NAD-dependent aldehyde dehydrogenase
MGVVGVIADAAAPPLLGLLSQLAPIIVSGNTVVALSSEAAPLPAILLGEILAVSDLPAGVVNLLTGLRAELVPTFATHAGLRALDAAGVSEDEAKTLGLGAAESVKRVQTRSRAEPALDLFSATTQGVEEIGAFVESKTVWHPVGA